MNRPENKIRKPILYIVLFLIAAIGIYLIFHTTRKNIKPETISPKGFDSTDALVADKSLLNINIPDDGKFTLVLDAGHGGEDNGAIVDTGRFKEKDFTLSIVKKIKPILNKAGIKTILTRNTDSFYNPIDRSILIQQYHADLVVSIHGNFIEDKWAKTLRGIEVYYDSANIYKNESKTLAENIFNGLKHIDSVPARRIMRKETGIYILRNALCPAVLVEAGYLTNPTEVKQLEKKTVQQQIASAIAKTLIAYTATQTKKLNLYDDDSLTNHQLWLIDYPDSLQDNAIIKINGNQIKHDDLYRLNVFDVTDEKFSFIKNDSGKTLQQLYITMNTGSKMLLTKKIDMSLAYSFIINKRTLDRNKLFYKFSYCKPNGETWVYIECNLQNKESASLNFFDKYPLYLIGGNKMASEKMKQAMNKDYKNMKACRAIEADKMQEYFTGNISKYAGVFVIDKSDAAIDSVLLKKIQL